MAIWGEALLPVPTGLCAAAWGGVVGGVVDGAVGGVVGGG